MKAGEEVSGDGGGEQDRRMAALRQQVMAEIAKRSRGGSGGHRSLSEESISTPDGQAVARAASDSAGGPCSSGCCATAGVHAGVWQNGEGNRHCLAW